GRGASLASSHAAHGRTDTHERRHRSAGITAVRTAHRPLRVSERAQFARRNGRRHRNTPRTVARARRSPPVGRPRVARRQLRPHADDLLPARPLVQWSFTDLTDSRCTFGRRLLGLTPDAGCPEPQKIGAGNPDGWCALVRDDVIFVKRFDWNPRASYPDFGC